MLDLAGKIVIVTGMCVYKRGVEIDADCHKEVALV